MRLAHSGPICPVGLIFLVTWILTNYFHFYLHTHTTACTLSGKNHLSDMFRDMASIRKKVVFVGNDTCGKSSLCHVFTKDQFPEVYVPTVFEHYVTDIEVDGKVVELALWDTAG